MTAPNHSETSSSFLSQKERERLLEAAAYDKHPYWCYAIICAWDTGLRLREVALLKWESIDLDEEIISVPIVIRDLRRTLQIPLGRKFCDLLLLLREKPRDVFPGRAYVYPDMARAYMIDRHKSLSCQFIRLCKRAGVEGKSFMSFHRTFIRDLLGAGVDGHTIAALTGITDFRKIGVAAVVPVQIRRNAMHRLYLQRLAFSAFRQFA